VIKSTSIDPSVVGEDGVYRHRGPAKVFLTEKAAMAAVKNGGIEAGDVLVLMCRGPMGSGMEEIFEITCALRYLDFGKHVTVLTDARFSGVSTGACIGHVTPEALAGGPLGKIRDGDTIEVTIDRVRLEGSVNLVVNGSVEEGARELTRRTPREDLGPDPLLPRESRLWAALQDVSGGTWGGCVFDDDAILKRLASTASPVSR
jgi:dihydroxyacid dehydratase/phosphogluconate dehydratase